MVVSEDGWGVRADLHEPDPTGSKAVRGIAAHLLVLPFETVRQPTSLHTGPRPKSVPLTSSQLSLLGPVCAPSGFFSHTAGGRF